MDYQRVKATTFITERNFLILESGESVRFKFNKILEEIYRN